MRVVAALGGNALSPPHGTGSVDEMAAALAETCRHLADLVAAGVDLVLTHGNGPQVGRILLQQEAAAPAVPPMPMDVCGAQSQGQIGYLLAQHLDNALRARGVDRAVLCLVTQVVVDGYDPAFRRPAKPVGPFFAEADARRIAAETGYVMRQFGDGRWRRVVASPLPVRFVEEAAVLQTIAAGHIVVAAGGGGVPVVEENGVLRGVEAVVDKDLSAARLADLADADVLLILTEVAAVQQGFGTADARELRTLTAGAARELLAAGEFPDGSMGPKVEAACRFVEGGGGRAVITDLANAGNAVFGDAGTQLTAG
ncbi:MAG TPA: carbamate kinase [Mycobacteriales bacterium]|nr:carbamate kinase [Mycobacteriales bacterium]